MMREYLVRRNSRLAAGTDPTTTGGAEQCSPIGQLDALCEGLARVGTRDELDSIGSLLADFASIQLQTLGRGPR